MGPVSRGPVPKRASARLLGPDSAYQDAFKGGTLTHTFLDVNDYHRYHFPVSGRIVELRKIPAVNGAGGITVWHPEKNRYVLIDAIPGWQMIETRDCVIINTEEYGLAAVRPIGRLPDLLLQLGGRPGGRLRRSERGPHGVFPFRRKRHRDGVPGRCGCGIPV